MREPPFFGGFLSGTVFEWRKRVGVEPTRRPSRSEHAGFEDQEGRRAPCASAADSTGTRRAGPTARAQRRVSVKLRDTLPQQAVPVPVACPLWLPLRRP